MNKIIITILLSCFFVFDLSAQTIQDALRYSRLQSGGTARSISSGGALSAFGGDFGTLSVNPAGIGAYRRSEVIITPSLNFSKTTSNFADTDFTDNRTNINLSNLGIVFSKTDNSSDWKSINFGIGMNRLTNNNQEFYYEGTTEGTITQRWQALANGNSLDQLDDFEAGPAYDSNILYQFDDTPENEYLIDLNENDLVKKEQVITRKGSVNDLNLTLGGNYRHKLYVGVTVGMPIIRFEEDKQYIETDESGVNAEFNSLDYDEFFSTTGVGFNAKLGVVYRMNQKVRLGIAVHTPTFFSLSDQFYTTVRSDLTLNGAQESYEAESPVSNFSYNLISPWRAIGSVGFMFGKHGFISGDVEFINYGSSQFNFETDPIFEQDLNTELQNEFNSAVNLRVGGEARFGIFAVRAGAAYLMSPYQDFYTGADEGMFNLSFGIGLREKNLFLDFGIARNMYSETYSPYNIPNVDKQVEILNTITKTQFVGSLGFKF
jgi:hypothetical protein